MHTYRSFIVRWRTSVDPTETNSENSASSNKTCGMDGNADDKNGDSELMTSTTEETECADWEYAHVRILY